MMMMIIMIMMLLLLLIMIITTIATTTVNLTFIAQFDTRSFHTTTLYVNKRLDIKLCEQCYSYMLS